MPRRLFATPNAGKPQTDAEAFKFFAACRDVNEQETRKAADRPMFTFRIQLGQALGLLFLLTWFQPLVIQPEILLAEDKAIASAQGDAQLTSLFRKHCVPCHGSRRQESELRLDLPIAAASDAAGLKRWQTIHERLEQGDMPPPDRPRLADAERTEALKRIEAQVAKARQPAAAFYRGPRRLNRVEYERTLQDLLGIEIPLAGMLPEDGLQDGSDKVGDALDLSPQLVERYLRAAMLAIDEAYAGPTKEPCAIRRYRLHESDRGKRVLEKAQWWAETDDAVVLWLPHDKWLCVEPFAAPVRGRYRVRISGYGCHLGEGQTTDKQTAVLAVHGGHFLVPYDGHLVGFFDLNWNQPTQVEFVDVLGPGDNFKLCYGGKDPGTRVLSKYRGPAVAIQWIEIEGPLPPEKDSRQMLLGDIDLASAGAAEADEVLFQFAQRAFRRPVHPDELASHRELMHDQFRAGQSFQESLRAGLLAVLCDPNFLFLIERGPHLTDHEIASRLSYFLWSSLPDEELLGLASRGKLREPAVRRQQVRRMLADSRAGTFRRHFLDTWLNLNQITCTTPDRKLYPEFDEPLQSAMLQETRSFFDELLANDLGASHLIDADFAMLNERLAEHYRMEGVQGVHIRKVSLPADSPRGGLITQASLLKVTANGTVTSPVLRGVWLLDRILGSPVPPPPPNVPAVEPDIRGATTIREQLARHKQDASCASCHRKIDPVGFALENFDAIGGWRDHYRIMIPDIKPMRDNNRWVSYQHGPVVESDGVTPAGQMFAGIREFKSILLENQAAIATSFTKKLFAYALGRPPEFGDRRPIAAIVEQSHRNNYGVRTLIEELAASEMFVLRSSPESAPAND